MRGYRILKKEDNLDLILNITEDIANQDLEYIIKGAKRSLFGNAEKLADRVVKQFLSARLVNVELHAAILVAIGNSSRRITYPIPPHWIPILRKYNFTVSRLSTMMFLGFLIKMVISGYLFSFNFLLKSAFKRKSLKSTLTGPSAYFDSLTRNNLPNGETFTYDVISWYLQWENRKEGLNHIFHSVKDHKRITVEPISIIGAEFPMPLFRSLTAYFRYIVWLLNSLFILPLEFFKGHWWNLALFQEASRAAAMRVQVSEEIHTQYLFHNSSWVYRPLWTYEAEKRGSEIIFYFYSTNCESFKRESGYPIQANFWQLMNWPRYIVWDNYQKEFVERAVGYGYDICVAGIIWFSTTGAKMDTQLTKPVAVFDVQPFRDSRYQVLGLDHEYYIPETACSFLEDIYRVVREVDCNMVLKRKRNISSMAHPAYRHCVKKLESYSNFQGIEADLSAQELIEQCEIVISMPFTSTALIARDLGKKSIYYDPHRKIIKDDRAAHGIEIIQGEEELREWLVGAIKK